MEKYLSLGIFGVILSTITTALGITAPWIGYLLLAIVLDYLTGMTSGAYLGNLNSRIGIKGIIKKLAMLLMVCAAFIVDSILVQGADFIGVSAYKAGWLVIAVCLALILNEVISILENLGKMDIRIPIMDKIIKSLKEKTDNFNVTPAPETTIASRNITLRDIAEEDKDDKGN